VLVFVIRRFAASTAAARRSVGQGGRKDLVKSGVKEIDLISQDTTYFGMDRWEGSASESTQRCGQHAR